MCDSKTPKPSLTDWYFDNFDSEAEAEASIKSETYHSSTHGYIKLSFNGRRLLANLRFAIQDAVRGQDYGANDQAVAKARGEIASYMNQLESKQVNPAPKPFMHDLSNASLEAELARRGYAIPPLSKCTTNQLCEELSRRKDWDIAIKHASNSILFDSLRARLGIA